MSVKVPAEGLPELRPIPVEWQRDATLLLEADLPSADQILQIDGVCRVLRIKLPINAFDARAAAAAWLLAQHLHLGARRVHGFKRRSQP